LFIKVRKFFKKVYIGLNAKSIYYKGSVIIMKKIILLIILVFSLSLALVSAAECDDGIDNDGDGLADYPDDPGCGNTEGGSEVANGVTVLNECTNAEGTGCGTKTNCHYDSSEQEIGYCLASCEDDFDCTSTFGDTYSCVQASSSSELYCLEISGCYATEDQNDRSEGGYVVTTYYQGSTDYMLVDYCSPIGQVEYYCSSESQASSSIRYTEDYSEGEVCYDGSLVNECSSDLDCVIGDSCHEDDVCLKNEDSCSMAGCDLDGDGFIEEALYETGDERSGIIDEKSSCEVAGGDWYGDVADVCASVAEDTNCNDGLDNDGDGAIDYPEDLGCVTAGSTREKATYSTYLNSCDNPIGEGCGTITNCYEFEGENVCLGECSTDSDCNLKFGEEYVCSSGFCLEEEEIVDEPVAYVAPQSLGQPCSTNDECGDRVYCSTVVTGDSTGECFVTKCYDGKDNDGDGLIDFPADSDCVGYSDGAEDGSVSNDAASARAAVYGAPSRSSGLTVPIVVVGVAIVGLMVGLVVTIKKR
jgi:hypothetical protein